jgi:hypothetical protein
MSDMTYDLARWLRAQLDTDAEEARRAGGVEWMPLTVPRFSSPGDRGEVEIGDEIVAVPTPNVALHIARHDPARVLSDVEADLALVKEFQESDDALGSSPDQRDLGRVEGLRLALQMRAARYADRPGYREEWRP